MRKDVSRRYVLLDRDGTIIVDKVYQSDPSLTETLPGAVEGLRKLSGAGFGLAVVSNQSGVNRGLISPKELGVVNQSLADILEKEGIFLERFYCCPHTPEEGCDCRKPRPGLALRAARELGFDPRESFVIGDREADIGLGKTIGATSILVRTGGGRETESAGRARPDHVADDLRDAAEWILGIASPNGVET